MPRPTSPRLPTISGCLARLALPRNVIALVTALATAACGGGGGGGTATPTLQSIQVAPGTSSVAKGLTQAFAATGHYSDGSIQDLTAVATWTSSDGAVATESNAAGSQGVATGTGIGQATISAAYGGQAGQATLTVTAAALQSISVGPGTAPVAKGLTQGFTATGHYSDGSIQDLTSVATWASSDPSVATVSSAGVATGVTVGQATISAAYGGRTGQATLTVTVAALQSVSVAPGTASVAKGLTQALTATGSYSDGTTQDLTAVATWTSSDPSVATVSSSGVAAGAGLGQATISAAYGGQTGQATLTVGAAALQSISVSPGTAPVAMGLTQAFTATGTYSDGTTQDLTAVATWTSSDATVATVLAGTATGAGIGVATVSAAYGGQTGQATLTVTAAALQSIAVGPGAASIAKGLSQAFTATGSYSDGTTQDLTAVATWTSSDVAVATALAGTATGTGIGLATISAAYGGQSGQATLTVTAAALRSIAVAPASASVAAGLGQALAATGSYSDGTTRDLTSLALWSSADPAVATVSASGVATGVAVGTTAVSAAYDGQVGSAAIAVTAAVLQAIAVAPPSASVAAGLTQAFAATGSYSDGTTQDLTAAATWTSSDPTVATVSGATATGLRQGQVLVAAAYGAVSGEAVLTVGPPVLQSLAVAPPSASVAAGLTTAFAAIGTFSDGSTQDVTLLAAWSSSSVSVATVSTGLATGVAPGLAAIDALYDGQLGTASLTVTAPVLQSLSVSPGAASIAKGLTQAFTATGHYSDGSTRDLTSSAAWASSDPAVATVSASGVATGVGTGSALVTADFGGATGQASLAVSPAALQSVSVAPPAASVPAGLTQAFTATGHYSDGTTQDLTSTATWTSSSAAAATVSPLGVATGVAAGQATISAAYGGQSGQATLTVTAAALQSISVAPGAASVAQGLTQAFAATGHYSDGTTQDLTSTATWTSSSAAVATVSPSGVATGVGPGTATVAAAFGGQSGQATLTVTTAVVQAVSLAPASASIPVGLSQAFTATAHWSDGSTSDVTATASWATLDPTVATVAGGVVKGVSPGTTQVHATAQGVTGSAGVAVAAAVVQAVTVSPADATLAAGTQLQYSAQALYSDGSKQDVTASATWASSNAAAATVAAGGLATGVAIGATAISATFSSVAGTTPLTVTAAILTSISISPSAPTVPAGFSQPFTATGIFSDGTKEDLTLQVTWTSSAPSVATISASGVATGAAVGSTAIGAARGSVSASTTLTVTGATLTALTVLPPSATIAKGTTVAISATGTYSDGTTQDLTALASWSSSGAAVAVSNAPGSQGVATGAAVGTADVTASYGGLSGSSVVTVTNAALVSIAVAPSGATVPVGTTQALVATGTFSDGTTQDLTALASWTSSNTAVAQVSNASGTSGVVTAISAGSVTIDAAYSGATGTAPLTVSPATLTSIQVTPANASLPANYTLQYKAVGTYSDGSNRDLTALATWTSSNTLVATISNAVGSQGLATGVAASATPVQIGATLGGKTGSTSLTVTSTKLSSIAVTPNPFSVAVGSTLQLTASGTFQDGTVLDISRQVGWSVTPRTVATVARGGVLTGVGAGTATVTAKKSGKSGSATGTVN